MRRTIIRIIMIFVFGSLLTYAWTWGWGLWTPQDVRGGPEMADTDAPIPQRLLTMGEFDRFIRLYSSGRGWHRENIMASDSRYSGSSPYNSNRIYRTEAGWPITMLAFEQRAWRSERSDHFFFDAPDWVQREDGGISKLPLMPVWPGFAIGVVCFGLAAYLPLAFFDVRRYRRRRNGWCLKCGYDLQTQRKSGGETRCPECGTTE